MSLNHAIVSRAVDVLAMSTSLLLVVGNVARGIGRDAAAPPRAEASDQDHWTDREPLIGPMAF